MKKIVTLSFSLFILVAVQAQTNPAITSWLQNTTGVKGRHYVKNNYTPIQDSDSANVQTVAYSASYVYIRTKGIPTYVTGPYLDGNPSNATSQSAIFKIPLSPTKNTGTATNTTGGNIGVFINGVALFDYRDGVSWKNSTSALAGGPLGGTGDQVWNRDAIVGELTGFDCAKGHPAMGNYHHHQNPCAFKYDLKSISTVCNLYTADGLYVIDSTQHSPLIGFTYDGFPIYGAYGYKNVNGTGGIVRMKSSYTKRNITVRNTYSNGTSVTAGPAVSTTYPLGYFREDYQYNTTSSATPDYLDEHNGRFCVTPEYPNGIYCYFATVDSNWNSAYPYIVGPTFYGVYANRKVTSITEAVTTYNSTVTSVNLSAFSVVKENNSNLLKWTASTQTMNSKFEIERSIEGINFKKMGEVKGAGTTINQLEYTFNDNNPNKGLNYYRLKEWDFNGGFSYSNVVTINNNQTDLSIRAFPNPATDFIILQIDGLLKKDVQVQLSNMKGEVVMKKTFPQGSTMCYLETSTIYAGNYILSVYNNEISKTFKIVINK